MKNLKRLENYPTEEKLIEEYGVSRNTIRNAIKILMNLGIIYPVQGSGMFVRAPKKKGTVYLKLDPWGDNG